jgi:hypothetical protein
VRFRDHALKGQWQGYRAIRLSDSYVPSAMDLLEKLMGGPLTLGGAISAIREGEGESLS